VNILNVISVLLGPAIAFFVISKFRTKLNSRDSGILMVCFFMAMVTVIPALVIKYAATELGLTEKTYSLFGKIGYSVFSAFVDEINKYIIIIAYAYRKREFDEPVAGILVCIMIGLGFTTVENIWHIIDDDKFSGTWRMLTAIPMTIIVAIVLGYYSGLSKYGLDADDLSSFGLRVRGLLTAVFFHGFYNFFLFMEEYKSLTTLIVIAILIVTLQVSVNLLRAGRLHTRLKYSRRKRSGTSEEAIF
jgi:RsiW-degrading membrane proteinase PrsW (M82 family)